jgi:sensor histidine kinase YesM
MLADSAPADGRLGIRNVNQRLRLIFGEQAGLEFSQDAHGNTVATIRQPLHPSAQAQTTDRNP